MTFRPLGAIKGHPRCLQLVPKHSKSYTTHRHAATKPASDFGERSEHEFYAVFVILCSHARFLVILACFAALCSHVCTLSPSLAVSCDCDHFVRL
jgi:hypothetical protein